MLGGYDEHEVEFLVNGFSSGFSVGFEGQTQCHADQNSKIAQQHPEEIDKFTERKLQLGRFEGPFTQLPFQKCHVSPLSLREKTMAGTYRLIHDLCFLYDGSSLVNDGIPENNTVVRYATVQDAIGQILDLG